MPAAVTESQSTDKPQDRNEQMWKVLKAHILRERARKRQEREAEVEEERLRKEREAREQQDVMTLGETREQITQLESKLTQLKEEKHQLFLQLKKVLNEDDNRRRQLFKDQNEMMTIQTIPSGLMHQQLYISPNVARSAPVNQLQTNFKPPAKRPRSPSPQPMVSVSMYHQGYGYKPSPVGSSPYQGSPQSKKCCFIAQFWTTIIFLFWVGLIISLFTEDDGRRNEFVRAVLWNSELFLTFKCFLLQNNHFGTIYSFHA